MTYFHCSKPKVSYFTIVLSAGPLVPRAPLFLQNMLVCIIITRQALEIESCSNPFQDAESLLRLI